jgi:hypothetical protein
MVAFEVREILGKNRTEPDYGSTMQQSSFCDTLITFEFRDHVEMDEDAAPIHGLDAQTLSPLLQCRNLENITISISYGHAAIDNSQSFKGNGIGVAISTLHLYLLTPRRSPLALQG